MPHRLLSGIAASPAPDHAKERALHDCLCDRIRPPGPVGGLTDQELAEWRARCDTSLIDSDMTYLVAGNHRTYWFMQLREAEREMARRQGR